MVTVDEWVNRYMAAREDTLAAGEIAQDTYRHCYKVAETAIAVLGRSSPLAMVSPDAWIRLRRKLVRGVSPATGNVRLVRLRSMVGWAYRPGRLTDRPLDIDDLIVTVPAKAIRAAASDTKA